MKNDLEDVIKKVIRRSIKEQLFPFYSDDYTEREKKQYICKLIKESAHAFDGQYAIAQDCTEVIIANLQLGNTEFTIETIDDYLPYINVTIVVANGRGGEIDEIFRDGGMHFTIRLLKSDVEVVPENLEGFLKKLMTHELTHGYITFKRIDNSQSIKTNPSYYKSIIDIMDKCDENLIYYFCRGLYLSYFHETQAFVSQAWVETENELKAYSSLYNDKEMFIDAFKSTNVANDFFAASFWSKRISEDTKLCQYVSKSLKTYGLNMTEKEVYKYAKSIVKKMESAIRRAWNNAYINWQESIKK